jgi:hypothetical protein
MVKSIKLKAKNYKWKIIQNYSTSVMIKDQLQDHQ